MGVLCGVDIIEIDRIEKSFRMNGEAFRDRIFTNREIEYCEGKKAVRHKSYAVRFAAKEAVSKAFGTGISKGLDWRNIEVLNDDYGKPYLSLSGKAKELYGELNGEDISLSLSHCENYAIAYVVIQTRN